MLLTALLISVFSHTFPHIPLHDAARHIHTPETVVGAYNLQPPGFIVTDAEAPVTTRDGSQVINLRYKTRFARKYAYRATLFASNPYTSHMLFYDDQEMPHILATLRLQAAGRTGHRVVVSAHYISPPTLIEKLIWPPTLTPTPAAIENAILWCPQTHIYSHDREHPHLAAYRFRVLAPLREPDI
jgi:hypothetical protein